MNRNMKKSMIFGMATMLMVSCGTAKKNGNSNEASIINPGEMIDPGFGVVSDSHRDMAKRNNDFALNLFNEVAGMDSKVISPISVTYLMSMLANGADGKTRQEIISALGWDSAVSETAINKNGEQINSKHTITVDDINELCKGIITMSGNIDPATTLKLANYVAVNKDYKLNPGFKETVSSNYMAEVENLDFSSSKTTSRINSWCSKQTGGMIPKIIDNVEPSAISYIMNAVYFNGTWTDKFDKSQTRLENFRGYTRDIKKVDMMHQNEKFFYTSNDTFAAVRLPYGNGSFSMTVLLPNEGKSVFDMMKSLNADKIASLGNDMENCLVDLKLPRFTSTLDLTLNDVIAKLGAPSMFSSSADFSNFADGKFMVSKMIQKAKIEVSEEGTKAAAVTAGIMTMSALNPDGPRRVTFHANRPFVYMITERSTGVILFIGQFTGDSK